METIGEIMKQTPAGSMTGHMPTSSNINEEEKVCPKCKGAGFVYALKNDGTPDYSVVKPCICTRELNIAHRQEQIQKYSNMGKLINVSFEKLNPYGKSQSQAKKIKYNNAYNKCKAYAENPKGWLYIYGKANTGKTYLAAAIGNKQYALNNYFLFITASDLLDRIRNSQYNSDIPYEELFNGICKTPLMIIDDYGIQSDKEWSKEKLDQIFNYRINYDLPLVITSSIAPNDLDDRLKERVMDENNCTIIELSNAKDNEIIEWPNEFELQKSMTFENFDQRPANLNKSEQDNLTNAYKTAVCYSEEPEGWLVFLGGTGCGKTHLASAIVNRQYEKGLPATFVVVSEMLNQLKASFSVTNDSDYNKLYESIKRAPLLVLDDFTTEFLTDWAKNVLYQLINSRHNSKLPTIVTTNISIQNFDSRIASRMTGAGTMFEIIAPDYKCSTAVKDSNTTTRTYKQKYSRKY